MLKNITISNFRCFEETVISNFCRVNLIGGRNNAGKTAFLEALYLTHSPKSNSILFLKRLRRESDGFLKNFPEKAWDNFFYDQKPGIKITITSENVDGTSQVLEISRDESVEELADLIKDIKPTEIKEALIIDDKNIIDLQSLIEKKYSRSTLHLNWTIDKKKRTVATLVAYSDGVLDKDLKIPEIKKVHFIPASVRLSGAALAQEYDKADLSNNTEQVLKAIQIVDDSIEQVKTFNIGEAAVYLKRKSQSTWFPISLYGEATNKVADFVLRLVNDRNSILLMDEVENGIHHSSQRQLWRMLFKLSVLCNAQVFVTTHSGEMLKAFADVCLEENNNELGAYVELTRNIKNNRITGIRHELETLKYELARNMGVRGE